MERCDNTHAIHIEKLPAQLGNRRGNLKHRLSSKCAEAADNLRPNRCELAPEEWIARGDFIRLGIAIIRRPAFQDIADVDVFAFEVDGFDDPGQQLACASDKRKTLLVFVETGGFADEDEFGLGIAGAEDDVGATRSELAALAVAEVEADGIQGLQVRWNGSHETLISGPSKRSRGFSRRRSTKIQIFHTDIFEKLKLVGQFVRSHFHNGCALSRLHSLRSFEQLHHAIKYFVGHHRFTDEWNLLGFARLVDDCRVIHIAVEGRIRATYGIDDNEVEILGFQ